MTDWDERKEFAPIDVESVETTIPESIALPNERTRRDFLASALSASALVASGAIVGYGAAVTMEDRSEPTEGIFGEGDTIPSIVPLTVEGWSIKLKKSDVPPNQLVQVSVLDQPKFKLSETNLSDPH
jgi:hypothetical protein